MKIPAFFKILKNKINKYDKMASNPFTRPQKIVVVWIEDFSEDTDAEKPKGG